MNNQYDTVLDEQLEGYNLDYEYEITKYEHYLESKQYSKNPENDREMYCESWEYIQTFRRYRSY